MFDRQYEVIPNQHRRVVGQKVNSKLEDKDKGAGDGATEFPQTSGCINIEVAQSQEV